MVEPRRALGERVKEADDAHIKKVHSWLHLSPSSTCGCAGWIPDIRDAYHIEMLPAKMKWSKRTAESNLSGYGFAVKKWYGSTTHPGVGSTGDSGRYEDTCVGSWPL